MSIDTLRIDLACALRWCAKLDMHEAVANHFSVAANEAGNEFLINPASRLFSDLCASDLIHANTATKTPPPTIDDTAWCLHAYFHQHLPQAKCLLHVHSPYATALASLKDWHMQAIDQNSCRFYNRVAYDENFGGMLLAQEEAARQCAVMKNNQVLVMRGHGILVVGETVGAAFDRLYYFERACRNQWLAMSTAKPLFSVDAETAEKTAVQWENYPILHFEELKRQLMSESPDFAS